MNQKSTRRETLAILSSVFFLVLGFVAVWFSREFLKIEGEALFVFLFLIPVLVYMIFSGRLSEFKAGSLEAKFVNVATQSVELESETIEPSVNDMEIVAKAGVRELQRQLRRLDESKPIILSLTLGREGYYDRTAWLRYMEALSQYRNFKFVVVLDKENKFVSYVPSWAMLQILRMEALGEEFVWIINDGRERELYQYPGVVTRAISTTTTNLDALREMVSQNVEALIVVDKEQHLRGVVEREQLLSKLLLGMAR